jgi:phage gp36-like protein
MADLNQWWDEFDIVDGVMTESELAILTGNPTGMEIIEDRIDWAEELARQEIEQTISKRYKVPIKDNIAVPLILRYLSMQIGIYHLYENYYKDSEVPGIEVWRRNNAMRELRLIATGEYRLNLSDYEMIEILRKDTLPQMVAMRGPNYTDDDLDKFYDGI